MICIRILNLGIYRLSPINRERQNFNSKKIGFVNSLVRALSTINDKSRLEAFIIGGLKTGRFFGFGVVGFSICVLFVSLFLPVSLSSQPPIDTSKFVEGTIGWGPSDADPGIAYDAVSGELIFNIYQSLITYSGEQYYSFVPQLATNVPTLTNVTMTVTNTSVVVIGGDPTNTAWTDGTTNYTVTSWTDEFVDGFRQGDVIVLSDGTSWHTWTVDGLSGMSTITLSLWHGSYVFNIDTTHDIFFYDNNGNDVGKFNVTDAAYSLQRYLVMDAPGRPIWMYDKPLFDLTDHTGFTNSTAMNLAHMINDAILSDTVANTLTINTGCHFPDSAFKQILSNTWGCIGSKNNTIAIGGWNGNLFDTSKYGGPYPDWWIDWAGQGNGIAFATLDPSDQLVPSAYCGTGPYHIASIDQTNNKVVMQKNPDFWMGWPAPGCNGSLDTVEIDYIGDWQTRKNDFLAGSIDTCAVPMANMYELLDMTTQQPVSPQIETVKNLVPTPSMNMFMFNFGIDNRSTYIGTGALPNGIPLDFFNNTHTRRAFAYSFDWSYYNQNAYFGESDYRKNWLTLGLYPDYYNDTIPGYYESLSNAEAELKAAVVDGQNVWNTGFNLTIPFIGDASFIEIAHWMIAYFFQTLSTFDGRVGSPFVVNLWPATWHRTILGMTQRLSPLYLFSWLADFADADDFCRPYMYSGSGAGYAYYQNYTTANGWGSLKDRLVDEAVLAPDGPARQGLYDQLQLIFHNDCPGFPVGNPRGRFWCQYWVKGWYYDAMYPSASYYTLWKADDCWYDVSGTTPGVSDGVCNMKDIAYLIAHFNVKAPVPGHPPDPKWVGVYGANGCIDPYGDRMCGMKDIAGAVQHFNHRQNIGTP
jgi:hypothetical protein